MAAKKVTDKQKTIQALAGRDVAPNHVGAFLIACALEGICKDLPEEAEEPRKDVTP